MVVINEILPNFILVFLTTTITILSLLCLSSPRNTLQFLIPCIFQTTTTTTTTAATTAYSSENYDNHHHDYIDDGDAADKNTALTEQILIRLLGGILLAYVISSFTFYMLCKKNVTKRQSSISSNRDGEHVRNQSTSNNGDNSNSNSNSNSSNDNEQMILMKMNCTRTYLVSYVYLGMSMLLVIIFEMASHDSESNHDNDNDNDGNYSSLCHNYDAATTTDDDTNWSPNIINGSFINVLSIATMIIVTSLLGLIASYSPDYNNNHDNDNDNNDSNPNSAFCCSCSFKQCLRRNNRNNAWQLPTHVTPNGDTYVPDEGGDDVDSHGNGTSDNTTPLLINDYLRNEQESTLGSLDTNESEHVISDDGIVHETRGDAQLESRIAGSRRLLKLAGPHAFYLFIGCLVLLVRLPFSLSIPHFVSVTLGALAKAEYETAKMSILFLFLFGTIDAILDFFCVFLFGLANLKIAKSVRIELFMKILGQEMGFFDKNKSGDLASRLNSDCGEMASDLTWFFRFSIESIVRIVGIVLYMFLRAPKLAICAVSVVPIVAIMNKRYSTWLSKNARDVQTALANANSIAQEALMNIRCVVAFGSEHVEKRKYKGKVDEHFKLNVKQLYATGFYYMLISTFLINTCVQALLLYVGMDLISNNQIQSEVLLAFMLYQSQLQNEVMNLFNSFTSLIKSSGAGDKVFELLDRVVPTPGTCSYEQVTMQNQNNTGIVEFGHIALENVFFAYPARPNEFVIRDLNLIIPRGKTIALIGKSGGGKSTIFSLLQRFYDPCSGSIKISESNDSNLKNLDVLRYRNGIGIVSQDPILFTGTIKSNIAYCAQGDVSDEDIKEAAVLANAHSFIEEFPQKYETEVGERGVQLSGGQKQRICIARSIISKPKLLLLDEATSALDSQSEKLVQNALDCLLEERKDMTTVIIAHRLQTIRNAHKIIVIEKGSVVEQGNHDELLANDSSMYSHMIKQAMGTNDCS